nr:DUF1653 domain-containing protein [Lachnospiraceae bacterium]
MRDNPKPFEVYRHFKGNKYQILTLATDSEDGSCKVVYQAMYGEYKVYVRDLAMFMSETDRNKYPDCNQKYRFEKVEMQQAESAPEPVTENPAPSGTSEPQPEAASKVQIVSEPAETAGELDPGVMEYLDAYTIDERINILTSMHHRITDDMLTTMAVVTDVELNEGNTEQKYQELKNYLLMKQKFEKQRY